MKFIVIGLGSMGKRRIKLLLSHFADKVQLCGVDTRADRRIEVEQLYGISTYGDLTIALQNERPTAALICTSPLSHSSLTMRCLKDKLHIFSELNLLEENHQEIISLADTEGLRLFLSSTLLYRREIDYFRQSVMAHNGRVHYRYHVGQYLPDWHPWESYQDFFVANQLTNGCRELFAIELPWLLQTFGPITDMFVIKDTISDLKLGYPDSYMVVFEHEYGHKGVLHVDVVSRKAGRSLEIYSDQLHIFWEGTPQSLVVYNMENKKIEPIVTYENIDQDSRYASNIIENAYLEELTAFIGELEGQQSLSRYSFHEDLEVLSLIDRIEGVEK